MISNCTNRQRWGLVIATLLLAPRLWSGSDEWQLGRIVDVQKNVTTKTLYWIVNTPITQDETNYTVSVHVKDKILIGWYELGRSNSAPPQEWVKDRPVQVQIDGHTMYLKKPDGDELKLHIEKRQAAPMLPPVAPAEFAPKSQEPAISDGQSLVGLSSQSAPPKSAPAASSQAAGPQAGSAQNAPAAAAQPPQGMISVSTVPYLADIYVDGKAEGYSPAKLSLAAGKHAVRLEKQGYKSWSGEVTITAGSQLSVAATLVAQ